MYIGQNRKVTTGQAEHLPNRTGRTGQTEQYRKNRTGRTGQAEQDIQNRTGRQDRQNLTG
jgi:hypothetical protein